MRSRSKMLGVIAMFALLLCREVWGADVNLPTFAALSDFPNDFPHEWTCSTEEAAQGKANAAVKNRFMDMYSWKTFVALNWPLEQGTGWEPKATFPTMDEATDPRMNKTTTGSDTYVPRWITWKESHEVFKKKGADVEIDLNTLDTNADETEEPLYDQNGRKVYYQIFVGEAAADYIKQYGLDTIKGQKNYNTAVDFQYGQCQPYQEFSFDGGMELKFAWKILDDKKDRQERFLKRTLKIGGQGSDKAKTVKLGLIGLHIAHKTKDHEKWIWSTFEQVDNLREIVLPDSTKIKPLFSADGCSQEDCPPNLPPKGKVKKTRLLRTDEIADDTVQLNSKVQELLREKGSVLQYYELIGTQYVPTAGTLDKRTPKRLRNIVIEPYTPSSSCVGCHQQAIIPDPKCAKDPTPSPADFSLLLPTGPCE